MRHPTARVQRDIQVPTSVAEAPFHRNGTKSGMTLPPSTVAQTRGRADEGRVQSRHAPRLICSSRRLSRGLTMPRYLLASLLCFQPVTAALLSFQNCLSDDYIYTAHLQDPQSTQLQWVPKFLDAKFNLNNDTYPLTVTVWGNVTGRVGSESIPAWNSTDWQDPTKALAGKIQNSPNANNLTTLHSKVDVATYTPYSSDRNFCDNINNGSCPLGPVFSQLA
jgi:hypothetical protein